MTTPADVPKYLEKVGFEFHLGRDGEIEVLTPPAKHADVAMSLLPELRNVRKFYAYKCDISEKGLVFLERIPNLEGIYFFYTRVCGNDLRFLAKDSKLRRIEVVGGDEAINNGISSLRDLKQLRELEIRQTSLTDESAEVLSELHNLVWLCLDDTKITDRASAELSTLKQLRLLSLAGTQISDSALRKLVGITGLESLCLTKTNIGRASLASLTGLTKLSELYLGPLNTQGSLDPLTRLPALSFLHLEGCHLSEADIDCLSQMKQLGSLSLDNCDAPRGSLEKLRQALPMATEDLVLPVRRPDSPEGISSEP